MSRLLQHVSCLWVSKVTFYPLSYAWYPFDDSDIIGFVVWGWNNYV
ncbi:hypothetical protein Godav_020818 [Gossypium davidsonii]|uniref:Uncharacterized protein n=1 Tax=Gossypium davidsonii TaxID=34287 RepID=A0A7J8R468_GOSDV|nr:hypothetical protein [Gossypium davidsonii]